MNENNVSLAINSIKEPFGSSYTFSILFFDEKEEVWNSEYYTERNFIELLGNLFLRKNKWSSKLSSTISNEIKHFEVYWDDTTGIWIIKIINDDVNYHFDFSSLLGKIGI